MYMHMHMHMHMHMYMHMYAAIAIRRLPGAYGDKVAYGRPHGATG